MTGPDDAVGERVAVAVGVVGRGLDLAAADLVVADERDALGRRRAERGAGQREPVLRRVVRLAHRVAPRQAVARVVDLVEDRRATGRARCGCGAASGAPATCAYVNTAPWKSEPIGPTEFGSDGSSGCRRASAAAAHWLRRWSVGQTTITRGDLARVEQPVGELEREGGLAGAGGRGGQEVLGPVLLPALERLDLPGAQPSCSCHRCVAPPLRSSERTPYLLAADDSVVRNASVAGRREVPRGGRVPAGRCVRTGAGLRRAVGRAEHAEHRPAAVRESRRLRDLRRADVVRRVQVGGDSALVDDAARGLRDEPPRETVAARRPRR